VVDGEYEPATTAFLKRIVRHDSVCVDVGANFGYYACLMGHLAWNGCTLAYEADPEVHALLVDNVAINWCDDVVTPVNAAVAADDGQITLHRWANRSANSGVIRPEDMHGPGSGRTSEPFTVRSITLDSLVGELPRVDVVKIDVEGAESMVVAGMSRFVERFRPTVVMEWSPTQMTQAGSSPAALAESVSRWDMECSTVAPDGHLWALEPEALVSLTFQNVVMTPRERNRHQPES
jgi:FkbM family methyltransferase